MRAVVFITEGTTKGTARSGQEYVNPLLVMSGSAYATVSFGELHERLCAALRGDRPPITMEILGGDGSVRLVFEDGQVKEIRRKLDS